MGWCSATEIIDTAIKAAEAAWEVAGDVTENPHLDSPDNRARLDDALRPFVATLAAKLRDQDWDREQDSDYFQRFPQEMLGHSDPEHQDWLVETIRDTAGTEDWDHWVGALAAHNVKMTMAMEGVSDGR